MAKKVMKQFELDCLFVPLATRRQAAGFWVHYPQRDNLELGRCFLSGQLFHVSLSITLKKLPQIFLKKHEPRDHFYLDMTGTPNSRVLLLLLININQGPLLFRNDWGPKQQGIIIIIIIMRTEWPGMPENVNLWRFHWAGNISVVRMTFIGEMAARARSREDAVSGGHPLLSHPVWARRQGASWEGRVHCGSTRRPTSQEAPVTDGIAPPVSFGALSLF